MTVTLRQVDGGLQLLIPGEVATQAGVAAGAELTISAVQGKITAQATPSGWLTIEELVAGITPENTHGEWDVGPPVGNEVW